MVDKIKHIFLVLILPTKSVFKNKKLCRIHIPQSLEVSKIKKNKKNFEIFWSSIINKGSYEMRFLRQHANND